MLPLIRDTNPGIYQVLTDANTDEVLTVPAGAMGFAVWCEAPDGTIIGLRVGIDQSDTAVTGLTGTDSALAYYPPGWEVFAFTAYRRSGRTVRYSDNFVHLASDTAGAVVKGTWLFADDDGN